MNAEFKKRWNLYSSAKIGYSRKRAAERIQEDVSLNEPHCDRFAQPRMSTQLWRKREEWPSIIGSATLAPVLPKLLRPYLRKTSGGWKCRACGGSLSAKAKQNVARKRPVLSSFQDRHGILVGFPRILLTELRGRMLPKKEKVKFSWDWKWIEDILLILRHALI